MSEAQPSEFKLPEPGSHHALLNPFEGTFRAEVQMFMGPGDPMVSSGKMTNSWQVNGLYLHQAYEGDPDDGPFPQFTGRGYWGYNTTTNLYEGFWVDTASTHMQLETGTVDETGRVFEMISEFVAPGTDKRFRKRSVFTVVDHDRHRMEAFIQPPGAEEMLHMQIDYTRV